MTGPLHRIRLCSSSALHHQLSYPYLVLGLLTASTELGQSRPKNLQLQLCFALAIQIFRLRLADQVAAHSIFSSDRSSVDQNLHKESRPTLTSDWDSCIFSLSSGSTKLFDVNTTIFMFMSGFWDFLRPSPS